ncbi:MAG TPA: DUF4403 family protein [Longimicrobium sp.]|nr:DUF4403 family protein [Longimicrobium sp.]
MRTPTPRALFALIALLLATAAGCGRDNVDVPPPERGGASRPVPDPEPSVVNLPVTVSLAQVAAQVENKVPRGQNKEDEWQPIGKFAVVGTVYVKEMWERDPLKLNIHDDHVDVSARVRYRARLAAHPCVPVAGCRWVQLGSCGTDESGPMPSMDVGLRTALVFHRDWTVAPKTRPFPVEPGVRCKLTEANIDVTERVQALVQGVLDRAAPQIDEKIRDAVDLRRRVEDVWSDIQQPIRASGNVFLLIQPESVAASAPRGKGTTLTTNVAVVVRPRVVIGDRPPVAEVPLPLSGTVAAGRGFQVQLVAELPYAVVDSILEKKLAGRVFDARGRKVTVTGAHLYGSGDRVVLRVRVKGDARGTIYLVGTPEFDPVTRTISVPDLDFSVESRQLVPKVAEWLMGDQLRDELRGAAHFELGDRVDGIRGDVDRALNRNLGRSVRMTGGVDALRPLGVFVFSRSLGAVVAADGHLQIHVDVRARGGASPPAASP